MRAPIDVPSSWQSFPGALIAKAYMFIRFEIKSFLNPSEKRSVKVPFIWVQSVLVTEEVSTSLALTPNSQRFR